MKKLKELLSEFQVKTIQKMKVDRIIIDKENQVVDVYHNDGFVRPFHFTEKRACQCEAQWRNKATGEVISESELQVRQASAEAFGEYLEYELLN